MQAGLTVVCGQGLATAAVAEASKKNLNAAKPLEQSKCLGGIGCKVFVLGPLFFHQLATSTAIYVSLCRHLTCRL